MEKMESQGLEMPGYSLFLTKSYATIQKYFTMKENQISPLEYPKGFYTDLVRYASVSTNEILAVLVTTVALTLLRTLLTKNVFEPMAAYFQLSKLNSSKFPESAFKAIFYSCTWSYCFYLLIYSGKYDYFQRPLSIWKDWSPGMAVPLDITALYVVVFSFYAHSVYATLYLDRWRKDSIVMLFHHFLTMALVGFSYGTRYHKIGLIVLFLHDISDICLESTKCHVYFKERGGKYYAFHDHLSTIGFLGFATTWFVFRLYWFPLKALHSAGYGVMDHGPDSWEPVAPFFLFFNVMLWILLVLNVYWFAFILNFLWRVATGKMTEVDDIREEEVLAKVEQKLKAEKAPKEYTKNGNSSAEETVMNGSSSARHRKKPQKE